MYALVVMSQDGLAVAAHRLSHTKIAIAMHERMEKGSISNAIKCGERKRFALVRR
jgi:hypothetical protein